MLRLFSGFALIAPGLICGGPAISAEPELAWPQWRGPNRDGVSQTKNIAHDWKANPPKLAWKAAGLGKGYASVSIAEGRIYSTGDRDGKQHVVALPLAGGKPIWSTEIGRGGGGGGYVGCRSTPTYDDGRLYVVGIHGALACLKADSGEIVWSKDMKKDFGGRMMSVWGYSESPLVDGDRLIATPGGSVAAIVALNKKTGEEIWRAKARFDGNDGRDGAGYSSIVPIEVGGVKQYVQLMGRGLVGVRTSDGKFLWSYNKVANETANIPTPVVVDGGYIFGSSGYGGGGSVLLKLTGGGSGAAKAEEVYWHDRKTLQNHHGGMIYHDGHLYGGHGHGRGDPVCFEAKTGKAQWPRNLHGPGRGSAAVCFVDGHLIFRYQNGLVALLEATPEKYREKGTFEIPRKNSEPSWPHPVVADGKLYLREQDVLFCYDLRSSPDK